MRQSSLPAAVLLAASALLLLSGAGEPDRERDPPPPPRESLSEIMARWKAFVAPLRNVPREVRVPEAKQFFATISWETLDYLCHEGSPGVGPDSTGILTQIMAYRLQVAPPTPTAIATMIASHDHVLECRSPLVAWVTARRDSLTPADRERIASACRSAATFPGLTIVFLDQLLVATAHLTASDSLMAGMMRWGREAGGDTVGFAVRMLSQAADPRAPDSLAALAREYQAAGSPHLALPLIHCRGRCGELALPVFVQAFEDSTATSERMVEALQAAATVPTLPAAQAILDRYRDGGVIADSTFTATGEERGRYYGLWLATRIAEPHLTGWLREGPEPAAEVALELFDRAFRFGPADQDSLVSASLSLYAARAKEPWSARAARVHERSLDPPQSARRPPTAPPAGSPPAPEGARKP
jgi:hypothetical protein